jgi:hypothetical protein
VQRHFQLIERLAVGCIQSGAWHPCLERLKCPDMIAKPLAVERDGGIVVDTVKGKPDFRGVLGARWSEEIALQRPALIHHPPSGIHGIVGVPEVWQNLCAL